MAYPDPDLLKAENTVNVAFADGDEDFVGTAVIRVALKQ